MAKLTKVAPGLYVRKDTPRKVTVSDSSLSRLAGKSSGAVYRTMRAAVSGERSASKRR